MGMEICQQMVADVAQRVGPRTVGVLAVATDAQDLGILLLEPGVSLVERGDLVCSTAGEVEYVEREDDVLLAPELAQ